MAYDNATKPAEGIPEYDWFFDAERGAEHPQVIAPLIERP